jgi:hypothetical protein
LQVDLNPRARYVRNTRSQNCGQNFVLAVPIPTGRPVSLSRALRVFAFALSRFDAAVPPLLIWLQRASRQTRRQGSSRGAGGESPKKCSYGHPGHKAPVDWWALPAREGVPLTIWHGYRFALVKAKSGVFAQNASIRSGRAATAPGSARSVLMIPEVHRRSHVPD